MKKIFVTFCVLALIAGATSCKKETPDPEPGSTPTPGPSENIVYPVYHEGQYIPIMKVSTVTENGAQSEEWTWDGDRLDYITQQEGVTRFNYTGDYITSVTNGDSQEMVYSYADGKLTTLEMRDGATTLIEATLARGNNGKISGADLDVDSDYLQSIIGAMTGFGKSPKPAPASLKALLQSARTAPKGDGSKFSITGNTITLGYTWNGENVATQVLNASVDAKLSQEEYESMSEYLPIPDQYRTIADMLVAAQGGLPLRITMHDTVTYTYDNRINPMFCFWGTMISADILSLNNILTATTTGSYSVAAVIMGQEINLLNNPMDDYEEFSYEYNSNYYPTKKTGGEDVTDYSYR